MSGDSCFLSLFGVVCECSESRVSSCFGRLFILFVSFFLLLIKIRQNFYSPLKKRGAHSNLGFRAYKFSPTRMEVELELELSKTATAVCGAISAAEWALRAPCSISLEQRSARAQHACS